MGFYPLGCLAGVSGYLAGVSGDIAVFSGYLAMFSGYLAGFSGYLAGLSGDLAGFSGYLAGLSGYVAGFSGNDIMSFGNKEIKMAQKKRDIPRSDADFAIWAQKFVNRIAADPAEFGISPAEAAELQDALSGWNSAYSEHTVAHNAARGTKETKDEAKNRLESVSRILKRKIQANPGITDAKRELLDIPVADKIRTPLSERIIQDEPAPVIKALCTASQTVRIDWSPSHEGTDSGALPQGIAGVMIWFAKGGIPADESIWQFLAMDTNSPYIHNVGNKDTVTIAYKAQWFDRRQRRGPFGDPVIVAVTP